MSVELDTCLGATRREYPEGYGFALAYLKDNLGPDELKALRDAAFYILESQAKKGNPDVVRFVAAYVESAQHTPTKGWPWYLVEAAQLVLAGALADCGLCRLVMRKCGHPGF